MNPALDVASRAEIDDIGYRQSRQRSFGQCPLQSTNLVTGPTSWFKGQSCSFEIPLIRFLLINLMSRTNAKNSRIDDITLAMYQETTCVSRPMGLNQLTQFLKEVCASPSHLYPGAGPGVNFPTPSSVMATMADALSGNGSSSNIDDHLRTVPPRLFTHLSSFFTEKPDDKLVIFQYDCFSHGLEQAL
ncbi:uncharacterized protein BT62DRAFT_1011165 [Guyanagaster necrorhizus]|uniref:Uncharacterized protein n=1 Tax=Guyanagaster necrorhizus TaxID=856835 RepID=A0A9P7VJX1_9AGAR|nr:uncharacterized protein BT62DRAFT_1011165 [Guyanagaster necrorhizus MCA 3950]KAG7441852.1 hypothetical protein BT62DRAFT_1011165 [Guyanagaster necrorhizus MCA 3950]